MEEENNFGPKFVGRGSSLKPANRFLTIELQDDFEHLEPGDELLSEHKVATEYFEDDSQTILSQNSSPDIPFKYSINPYRGCAHGCSYCYARPTHEYLGLNAGIDFESKIFIKRNASHLFRAELEKKSWTAEPVMLSGVTDPYQPAERRFQITRACLEVAKDFRQPVGIITKNALVTRDIDLLAELAQDRLARVAISLTTLDQNLTRQLEPRTSSPAARLRAIGELADAGIETTVMTAPLIPGLTDEEVPRLLEAAAEHGAKNAGYIILRLPQAVRPVFLDWIRRCYPDRVSKVEGLLRGMRSGGLNQSEFGTRMRGTGEYADLLSQSFKVFARKFGLSTKTEPLNRESFRRPSKGRQLDLF